MGKEVHVPRQKAFSLGIPTSLHLPPPLLPCQAPTLACWGRRLGGREREFPIPSLSAQMTGGSYLPIRHLGFHTYKTVAFVEGTFGV